ncbi:MAG: HmuY family protein [Bacteroidia bacterium]|nr:HmuY family protein [Bacteroidia bacterium]
MKKVNKLIFILLSVISMSFMQSCMKDELPIPKHDPGNVITATFNWGTSYNLQVFYSLESNSIVSKNIKSIWDLGFETKDSSYHILLNSSKLMFAYNTGKTDFNSVSDTVGLGYYGKCDAASGNYDSTAIGNWVNTNHVYIIDRGYDEVGYHKGYRKIQFLSVSNTQYKLRVAKINGLGDTTLVINKDNKYNLAYLYLEDNTQPIIEPPKDDWDFVFTQYTHVFTNPYQPYIVAGCLLNRNNTLAAVDKELPFGEIAFENVYSYSFSDELNTIGYSWKTFDGDNYTVNYKYNYIIKNSKGYYYKLHFIDFYNSSGVKGNPKWEYQKL